MLKLSHCGGGVKAVSSTAFAVKKYIGINKKEKSTSELKRFRKSIFQKEKLFCPRKNWKIDKEIKPT